MGGKYSSEVFNPEQFISSYGDKIREFSSYLYKSKGSSFKLVNFSEEEIYSTALLTVTKLRDKELKGSPWTLFSIAFKRELLNELRGKLRAHRIEWEEIFNRVQNYTTPSGGVEELFSDFFLDSQPSDAPSGVYVSKGQSPFKQ